MLYQVRINFFFFTQKQALGLYNHAKTLLPQAAVLNPDSDNLEYSTVELIENHHDEAPRMPCSLIKSAANYPQLL